MNQSVNDRLTNQTIVASFAARPTTSGFDKWYWPMLIGIFIISLVLRFWGLSRFNTFIFDEVYFANFGQDYLTHTPVFDAHPPLGKYFIAFGIWLKGFNSFGYRWVNALTGSFIPTIAAGLAYQLSHRRSYAVIAGLLVATDGLLLVESRYALLNIYLLLFGLLGHWCLILAAQKRSQWRWLTLAGICLGATVAVKWSGLSFIMAGYIFWVIVVVGRTIVHKFSLSDSHPLAFASPLASIARLKLLPLLLWLPLVAVLIYHLSWLPHMRINPSPGMWEVQSEMYNFHKSFSNKPELHAYCSGWFTWPFMIRPIAYYYQDDTSTQPATIYDVHAMGNPLLYWFSTMAMILSAGFLLQQIIYWVKGGSNFEKYNSNEFYLLIYLMIGYSVNLFSWAVVSRFTFLYHFMPASVFGFLNLAWWVDRFLHSDQRWQQQTAKIVIVIIVAALVFWLPIYLGLPLSPTGYQLRMWLPSWI